MVDDLLRLIRVSQCRERLFVIVVGRRDRRQHNGEGISAETVLQRQNERRWKFSVAFSSSLSKARLTRNLDKERTFSSLISSLFRWIDVWPMPKWLIPMWKAIWTRRWTNATIRSNRRTCWYCILREIDSVRFGDPFSTRVLNRPNRPNWFYSLWHFESKVEREVFLISSNRDESTSEASVDRVWVNFRVKTAWDLELSLFIFVEATVRKLFPSMRRVSIS